MSSDDLATRHDIGFDTMSESTRLPGSLLSVCDQQL